MTIQDLRQVSSMMVRIAALLLTIGGMALSVNLVLEINFYDFLYFSDVFDRYGEQLPGLVMMVSGIGMWMFHRPISHVVVVSWKEKSGESDSIPSSELDSFWFRRFLLLLVTLTMAVWGSTLVIIATISFIGSSFAYGYEWNLLEENSPKAGLGISLMGGAYLLNQKTRTMR